MSAPASPPLNTPLLYGLLSSVLMVVAPHAIHLPGWEIALCAALLVWRFHLTVSGHPLPGRLLLTALTLAGAGCILGQYHTLFGRDAGVALLMLLASFKLLELNTRRDAVATLLLACFVIITNFLYTQSLAIGLYMLATLLVIVTTWIQLYAPGCAFRPRLRIAATLLAQAIPLMLVLFVLFPRVQGPLWGLPNDAFARSGLDDRMSPGSMGRLALSDEVAFRVVYQGAPPRRDQMYWRGPVLWHFDGQTWTAGRALDAVQPTFADIGQPVEYTVTLEPNNKPWLFVLDMPDRISTAATMHEDFQVFSAAPVNARLRYEARSQLAFRANLEESHRQLRRALQLPQGINPRTRQLAAEWRAASPDAAAVVRRALDYFNRQEFHYTLEPPPLTGPNGMDEFLFATRQGFCEHYAAAFVFLMRAAGVPARVVNGYQGGEYNAYGNYYIVRQSDAHAWAEVWLADKGWLRVDPTAAIAPERVERGLSAALPDNAALPFLARDPPQWLRELRLNLDSVTNRWNQWVIGYDSERQFAFLSRFGLDSLEWRQMAINILVALAALIGLFALFMLRRLIASRPDQTQAAWLRLCRKLARAGLPREPHEGPWDYALRVSAARPDLSASVQDLAARYITLRYAVARDPHARREFIRAVRRFSARP
ncbi:MAG: transglutaminaseTgpA domain-containing protein [Gallionella sp.]|nr:transglutaminaseTgpA domain-containing protein [Gallionella sp.]MDD4945813.1 transglutaminaseTgpA domain-containing protein [Gallionella sp.]MDD5612355.1 transglutaminaseTgpA domain-containing protein [Gallionella sp.]